MVDNRFLCGLMLHYEIPCLELSMKLNMRKKKSFPIKKELFRAVGEIKLIDGQKRWIPYSPPFFKSNINRLSVGRRVSAVFSSEETMRSLDQLRYHFVLCEYLSDHTGFSKEEVHDAIMRIVFGTKTIHLGNEFVTVRRSFSTSDSVSKLEAVSLIEKDLDLCHEFGIVVPSKEELGYLSD